MRIACVDISAKDRLKLEQFLDDAFRDCRKSVGHMAVARFFPASREEILVNSVPDGIVIGSGFSPDEALVLARDISTVHPDVPLFVFFAPQDFTLRNIRRFEPCAREVFSITDPPSRFVHSLTSAFDSTKSRKKGVLFAVQGVKGGVGVTTITGALAHASQALGKSVVVMDLSLRGELCQYFLCEQWQSSEYSTLLTDKTVPDPEHIEKILIRARNGISVVPPPMGNGEIREFWLRDTNRFEISLAIIDLLQERFDVVLVDFSHAEGIFPFAVECRADIRLFLSANEPGSIHLLTNRVDEFEGMHEGVTKFLINRISPRGLTNEDILDFVAWSPRFTEEMLYPSEVPYDLKGGLWIGTGNSFYTEGNARLRSYFEDLMRDALGLDDNRKKTIRLPFANALKAISNRKAKKQIEFDKKERLPFFESGYSASDDSRTPSADLSASSALSRSSDPGTRARDHSFVLDHENEVSDSDTKVIYEPPRLRMNQ
jgi:cellulose biosynthesis protein BcsQ